MYIYLTDVSFRSKEPLVALALNILTEVFFLSCWHTPASYGHSRTLSLTVLQWHSCNSRICWTALYTSGYWLHVSPCLSWWM